MCDDLGMAPSVEQRRALISEMVWLANPYAFSGIDAVIPARRTDLMRAWFFHRLTGVVETPAEVQRMARAFAPVPDDDVGLGLRCFGDPTSADVAAAYASRQRRRTRDNEEVVTTSN